MLSDIETLAARGHVDEALAQVHRLLDADPDSVEALSLAARLELARKNYESAIRHATNLCALAPESADSWYVLGRTRRGLDQNAMAIDCFRRAIRIKPDQVAFHVSLGAALRAAGQIDEAMAAYRQALVLDPSNLAARRNLLNAQVASGQHTAAGLLPEAHGQMQDLQERCAIQARRRYASGDYAGALYDANIGLERPPHDAALLEIAAAAAVQLKSAEVAVGRYEQLAAVAPSNPSIRRGLLAGFDSSVKAGRRGDVDRYVSTLLRLEKDPGVGEILRRADSLVLPAINKSRAAILESRGAYERALDELLARDIRLPGDSMISSLWIIPSFYLAYHGECDRELMIKAARLWANAIPSLRRIAPHCAAGMRRPGRIRLGIVSRFLHWHSIGKTTAGLLREFDREAFEIFLLHIVPSTVDETTRRMRESSDHYLEIPEDQFLNGSAERIEALELDVLFFQDIGMEPCSYYLAFARFAPVQCVSYGHPNTTGIATMDYFVSNDLYETQTSAAHYSESLFTLRDLPTLAYYYRPRRRELLHSRAQLGLPETGALYVCPQTLFKLHPDFDDILRGILERDPTGHVVLIRGGNLLWYGELLARIEAALGASSRRIIGLGELPQDGFLDLLACCDVMLDTPHFNGMNSSLEAFAVGLPIVTLPTGLQRGRHTLAMYRKMGITDCIAADPEGYIDIAVRLGTDREFNAGIRRAIAERSDVLYENVSVVREFERFFFSALAQKGVSI